MEVVGGGMVWKAMYVKKGDLPGVSAVFMTLSPKSRPGRSQSAHSSDEAG